MSSILCLDNLSIQIGNRILFHNVSFNVSDGDVVLLSGTNGIGKSVLLKSILRLEEEGKIIKGKISTRTVDNVLALSDHKELQQYRSRIAYVPQRDDYAQMGNVIVKDIISDSNEAFSGRALGVSEVNDLIDNWVPRRDDNSRVFDAKSRPAKFSGGEQRLLSLLSVIATRSQADLFIIDEPLNNLDFVNAKNISNLINKVIKMKPETAILMVSHCRIFPFITREIKLASDGIREISETYTCYSCLGVPNEEGFY